MIAPGLLFVLALILYVLGVFSGSMLEREPHVGRCKRLWQIVRWNDEGPFV